MVLLPQDLRVAEPRRKEIKDYAWGGAFCHFGSEDAQVEDLDEFAVLIAAAHHGGRGVVHGGEDDGVGFCGEGGVGVDVGGDDGEAGDGVEYSCGLVEFGEDH